MTEKLSKMLTFVGCVLSFHVFGVYRGFLVSSGLSGAKYPIIAGSWWSHLDPYSYYDDVLRTVSFLFLLVIISFLFANNWLIRSFRFVSLGWMSWVATRLIYWKSQNWNNSDEYLQMSQLMYSYEIILISAILIIMALELVSAIRLLFRSPTTNDDQISAPS